jgi:hypothetical protein
LARFYKLEDLRLLSELRAWILIDKHSPLAQFLEPFTEDIARNAISSGLRLVIGEAIMLHLLRYRG